MPIVDNRYSESVLRFVLELKNSQCNNSTLEFGFITGAGAATEIVFYSLLKYFFLCDCDSARGICQ